MVGLGSVALLVGGIAIANIMAMSVLERRMEIGIRRALGATKRHIGLQFLTEAVLLAAIGGVAGVVLGAAITIGFVMVRGLVLALPVIALGGALGAALVIGAVAGIYPATRAARVSPAEAVKSA
jgi:putative ABC transport system permease protein